MSTPVEKQLRSYTKQRELLGVKLEDLQERKFYGRVTLEMCAGNIVQARIEESWKLQEEADGLASEEAQANGVAHQEAAASP